MILNIRQIQHYMYCPRRFGLLEVNKDWAENVFVIKANIIHENVHSAKHKYHGSSKIELSSVAVYNDDLELYGNTDCIEFVKSADGVYIDGLQGRYGVNIIEYKPSRPRDNTVSQADAIQVYAQKLCADYIWKCKSSGYIYYSDVRKRIMLPFDEEAEEYSRLLDKLMGEMREIIQTGIIPDRKRGQKCSGCSIQELCIPQKKKYSVRSIINEEDR